MAAHRIETQKERRSRQREWLCKSPEVGTVEGSGDLLAKVAGVEWLTGAVVYGEVQQIRWGPIYQVLRAKVRRSDFIQRLQEAFVGFPAGGDVMCPPLGFILLSSIPLTDQLAIASPVSCKL